MQTVINFGADKFISPDSHIILRLNFTFFIMIGIYSYIRNYNQMLQMFQW